MQARFEQFIRERQYFANVTPATIEWYRRCLKWLLSENPTQDDLRSAVLRMREKGLKETGVNTVLRCVNAYLHWSSSERKCDASCNHPRMQQLREPRVILPTFTEAQVKRLIAWKPKTRYERRLHLLILFLLDTGCRITEALTLCVSEIDFQNLLVALDGKGQKQRIIPFSFELRRALFRHLQETNAKPDELLFASRTHTLWARRNVLRDVKLLCRDLGFTPPHRTVHAFRHTFAVNYPPAGRVRLPSAKSARAQHA
jgi:integrase/recombinase XerD